MPDLEKLKERRARFRREGLCPACGSEPEINRVYCSFHLRYFRQYQRERKRKAREGALD